MNAEVMSLVTGVAQSGGGGAGGGGRLTPGAAGSRARPRSALPLL